jgi:hypothetical protein
MIDGEIPFLYVQAIAFGILERKQLAQVADHSTTKLNFARRGHPNRFSMGTYRQYGSSVQTSIRDCSGW